LQKERYVYRLKREKGTFGRRLQAWHVYLLLGVLAIGAYFLLPSQAAQHALRLLFVISALVATVTGILMHRPNRPLPWYLFASAMLMGVLGIVTYGYYEAVLGIESPSASVADAFFIASYPCSITGLLLIQSWRLVRDQASTIDPIIVAIGIGMLAWPFLLKPYVEDPSLSLLERLVSIAYPLMDVLLVAVVVRLLLVPSGRPFAHYPLVTSLVSLLVFDAAYAAATLVGTYETGSPIEALELLFFVLFGVTALHPSMADLSETVLHPETRLTRRRLALLAAASLTAPGVLALQAARGESIDVPVIVGGSVVLFLLVLARMASIMRSREQAIDRESILRRAAAALVAATDRESIYAVALEATRELVGETPKTRVAIAMGSPEEATLVAATSDHAGEAAGARIYLDEYPGAVRAGLLEGRVVEAERLHNEGGSEALLGFDPRAETVFFIPLFVQARVRGVILVLTDSTLSEDKKATLEALGREVALALESAALTEEVHRRKSEERFRSLVQNSSDVVAVVGADGVTRYVSPAVERILGCKPEEGVGHSIFHSSMMHPDDADRVREVFAELIESPGASATADFRLRHADGRWIHVEAIGKNLLANPNIGGVVLNYRDVTERKTFEERLRHQAFHDPLTNLPNRALFMDRLYHALAHMERGEKSVAVLFMDLDNFKVVNDSLGHEAGDLLLVSVAERLWGCLRPEDTAARFGGDEFTILLEDVTDVGDAVRVADRIRQVLKAPFVLDGRELFITTSIGIALGTSGLERPTELLRDADVALYRAKASGKSACEVFDTAMYILALERLDLEADLRRAIERGEFAVHYQPQLELPTGRIVGWEALARWRHPERGLILPSVFLSVAEETGLITPIGNLVLEEACQQAKEWQERCPATDTPLKMSVNISARQFQRPDQFVREVARVLEETELPPGSLVLEITESLIMEDAEHNIDVLGRLKDLGVRVAVDDFGTGYSNLAYLKRFPVDMLKVDKSFIDGLEENPEDTAIVEAVVSLAHALGLRTVAEGIETTGQLDWLRALGCELGQGYYFSKPLPAHEASTLLSSLQAAKEALSHEESSWPSGRGDVRPLDAT
jgi:diguanylate cyclase (GGDEF)-like protein/PAS domain S-box-containing protein